MTEQHGPQGPEASIAGAVDDAAEALLAVGDAARERATSRLSNSQLRALLVVEEYDGINLRRLAGSMGVILSSASRLCDRLVAAGMLAREPSRVDRREIALHLTPVGRALLDELRADRRQRLAVVLQGMTAGGRQALLRGLREFGSAARAGTTDPGRPAPPGAGYGSGAEPPGRLVQDGADHRAGRADHRGIGAEHRAADGHRRPRGGEHPFVDLLAHLGSEPRGEG